MPKLNEVISAILSSLNNAQHQSNKSSRSLADSYKNDDIMKYFALPNASLSEVDITLKYAIKDVGKNTVPQDTDLGNSQAESLYSIRQKVTSSIDLIMQNETVQGKIRSSNANAKETENRLVDDISRYIYQEKQKKKSHEEIADGVTKKCQTVLGEDMNLKSILNQGAVSLMESVAAEEGDGTGTPIDDVEVIVDNDILQGLPESIIQTIQLKARMKNYNWIVDQNSAIGEFVLSDR